MGNGDHSAICERSGHQPLHLIIGPPIQRTRWLIHEDVLLVQQDESGNTKQLPFSDTVAPAPFQYPGIKIQVEAHRGQHLSQPLIRNPGQFTHQVEANGAGKQIRVLGHHAEMTSQTMNVHIEDRHITNPDITTLVIDHAKQCLHEARLTRPGTAHDAHLLTVWDCQCETIQNQRLTGTIRHGVLLEPDVTGQVLLGRARNRMQPRLLGDLIRKINHEKGTPCMRGGLSQKRHIPGKPEKRTVEIEHSRNDHRCEPGRNQPAMQPVDQKTINDDCIARRDRAHPQHPPAHQPGIEELNVHGVSIGAMDPVQQVLLLAIERKDRSPLDQIGFPVQGLTDPHRAKFTGVTHHRRKLHLQRNVEHHHRNDQQARHGVGQHNQQSNTQHLSQAVGGIPKRHHAFQAQHAVVSQQSIDEPP